MSPCVTISVLIKKSTREFEHDGYLYLIKWLPWSCRYANLNFLLLQESSNVWYRHCMGYKRFDGTNMSRFLIPGFADAVFAIFFYCSTCIFGQKLLGDGDTGYHIRVGEYILKTLSIPHVDMFSFISPPLPWTAHEWLSEVIMALIHGRFGMTGVVLFYGGMIATLYTLLFVMMRRLNGHILVALAVVMLAITSSMLHWLARPHIFSLLMMVIWYGILDSYQYEGVDRLYQLPLLMLLWVNLHGGFITGFIMLGIYVTGNLYLGRFGAQGERGAAGTRGRRLLKISLLSLLVSLVNPSGYKILLFPFTLVSDRYMMDQVVEFISPNFHEASIIPFRLFLLLLLGLVACSRRPLNIIQVGLLLFFTNMALYSVRYITLFAIAAAPIAALTADRLLNDTSGGITTWLRRKDAAYAKIDEQARGFLWPILIVILVLLSLRPNAATFRFDEKLKAVAAVEFLKREQIPGNMFDNDEFGDYTIYAAWPRYHVFVDGRLDMYGSERLKEYNKVVNFEAGWESVMKKYDMNWVFYTANSPLCRYLHDRVGWRLIYADKVANIFVRDIPLYQPLIRKYPDVKPLPPDCLPQ